MKQTKPKGKLNGKDTTDNASAATLYEYQEMVVEKFWQLTDRKKKLEKTKNIGPECWTDWGTMHEIQEKSNTLKCVINSGGVNNVRNLKQTFEMILNELELDFKIENMKSFKPCNKIVTYDIRSIPPWSFTAIGPSVESAKIAAARQGLEFFVVMCS